MWLRLEKTRDSGLEKSRWNIKCSIFATNYNWNSGFDVPKVIFENDACNLETALLFSGVIK